MNTVTREQAVRFLLRKQGLWGRHRFVGKEGAYRYIRQAGCIQFDPIDVCGKNAELVLQSRVKGFRKEMLPELLYQDRVLVDHFDKNLSVYPAEDWPCFSRIRAAFDSWEQGRREIGAIEDEILGMLKSRDCISSKDLPFDRKIDWPWAPARLSRAALESLYFRGKLAVHHKEGTVKFYARPETCFSPGLWNAPDPLADEDSYFCWRVRRRIGAVGLLWNKPSDAWLGIDGLKSPRRAACFSALEQDGSILPVRVEGLRDPLFYLAEDAPLWEDPEETGPTRTEFLAPLDCMMWDRNLIRVLFCFDYKWEIYTPAAERKFGYYVLPVLHGEKLAGRVEAVRDSSADTLAVRHFWPEAGVRETKTLKRAVASCARRFAKFNQCGRLLLPEELVLE